MGNVHTNNAEISFLRNISLYRFIGNELAVDACKTVVREHLNSRADNSEYQPPTIALMGRRGGGRRALGYAISNAFGNQSVCEVDGGLLSLKQIENAITGYADTIIINNADGINPYGLASVCDFLRTRVLEMPPTVGQTQVRPFYYDGLIIVAIENNLLKTGKALKDAIDVKVAVSQTYSESDVIRILNQRADFYRWRFSDRIRIIGEAAKKANGNAEIAINLLLWTRRCATSDNCDKLLYRHLVKAIRLVAANGI